MPRYNTLEHLVRIAGGDQEHIIELKRGNHGSLPFKVMEALYPREKWMFVKYICDKLIVAPLSQYDGGDGPMKIGVDNCWITVVSSHATMFSRSHWESHMDLWIVENCNSPFESDEYAMAHYYFSTESYQFSVFKELNKWFILRNPEQIRKFFNPSKELIKVALDSNPHVYHLLKNPSDEITEYVIKKFTRLVLQLDSKQLDPKWLTMALECDFSLIKEIENPTEDQIWTALKKNVVTCVYVTLTDDMKWFALR